MQKPLSFFFLVVILEIMCVPFFALTLDWGMRPQSSLPHTNGILRMEFARLDLTDDDG